MLVGLVLTALWCSILSKPMACLKVLEYICNIIEIYFILFFFFDTTIICSRNGKIKYASPARDTNLIAKINKEKTEPYSCYIQTSMYDAKLSLPKCLEI